MLREWILHLEVCNHPGSHAAKNVLPYPRSHNTELKLIKSFYAPSSVSFTHLPPNICSYLYFIDVKTAGWRGDVSFSEQVREQTSQLSFKLSLTSWLEPYLLCYKQIGNNFYFTFYLLLQSITCLLVYTIATKKILESPSHVFQGS